MFQLHLGILCSYWKRKNASFALLGLLYQSQRGILTFVNSYLGFQDRESREILCTKELPSHSANIHISSQYFSQIHAQSYCCYKLTGAIFTLAKCLFCTFSKLFSARDNFHYMICPLSTASIILLPAPGQRMKVQLSSIPVTKNVLVYLSKTLEQTVHTILRLFGKRKFDKEPGGG